MNFASERRLTRLAALSLVCLIFAGQLRADEAPATDQAATPGRISFLRGGELQTRELSNTDLALGALYLATNTDWIGAEVAQVDDVLRSHLGLCDGKGLVVTSISDGGPAAKAGVQQFDVLVTVGGEEVAGVEALRKSLEASADKAIALGLIRGGKKKSVEVVPHSTAPVAHVVNELSLESRFWLGLGLAAADDALRVQLGVPGGEGLVVTSIENDSPAAKAGVMVNDVLLKLDGKALTTTEALDEQLQTIADKSAPLELLRHGKPAMLTVTPVQHASNGTVQWFNINTVYYADLIQDLSFPVSNLATNNLYSDPTITNQYINLTTHNPYFAGVQYPWLGLTQGQSDIANRINDVEAQLKHLEAALAALRSAIETTKNPSPGGEDKK